MDQIQTWAIRYPSVKSQKSAITSFNRFEDYADRKYGSIEECIESMRVNEDSKYQIMDDFIRSINVMPASKRQYYAFVKNYLRVIHGIKLDIEDSKDFIKFPKILKITREPLLKSIIRDFVKNASVLHKAFYLIQTSSGMRASESLNLKRENFDLTKEIGQITIPAILTKTQTERITFISKEATKFLINNPEYFEIKNLDNFEKYFSRLRKRLGYLDKYENTPNYKVNIHSMRAFFRTEAGKINQDFAEAMIGHGYLKQYIRLTPEDLKENYKKLEPKLRILS